MASRFHRLRARQAEREPLTAHGRINLVPLVDILTAIVFFSLLTYTGAVMTNLTAFDLALPPVVVTPTDAQVSAPIDTTKVLVAVGIKTGGLRVEGAGSGVQPFAEEFAGLTDTSMILVAVGIRAGGLRVEGAGNAGQAFAQEIAGLSDTSLTQLRTMLTQIKEQYKNSDQIMVVPDDDVAYDDIVHVLEQVKQANFKKISLSSAARSMNLTSASAPGAR